MIDRLEGWLKRPLGSVIVGFAITFAAAAAGAGDISWLVAVLIVAGVAVIPPLLNAKVSQHREIWSWEVTLSAVGSAAFIFVITLDSVVAGVLSVGLALIAYSGGRYST